MGLIKLIFGIIGGLFQAIAGLVGLGKKSEFYMELPKAEQLTVSTEVKPTPTVVPQATATEQAPAIAPAAALSIALPNPTPAAAKPAPTAPAVPSFAANYLTNPGATPASRRRPGPSLSPFLTMAKQVKA
jgi:hypothetical protein